VLIFGFLTVLLPICAFLVEALIIWSIIHGMTKDNASVAVLVLSWLTLFPVTLVCIGTLLMFTGSRSAEERVESEMQEFLKKPCASQS
jgi:hypothetical protein